MRVDATRSHRCYWALAGAFLIALSSVAAGQTALPAEDDEPPFIELSPGEIEDLVAPIALFPDVLLSQVLPAATFPTDVVQAARWVRANPDLNGLDDQPWDLSVLSISRFPPVLDMMDDDLEWTIALGAAFMDQPDDVMDAIQTLRQIAADNGALTDTPQQVIVRESNTIIIAPAQRDVIFVPQYNPRVIFVDNRPSTTTVVAAAAIGFSAGFALGWWLDNDIDWRVRRVVCVRPGWWGGWGWRGVVVWDNDWARIRAPRRGVIVTPGGGAIWGPGGRGAVWRRPTPWVRPVRGGAVIGGRNVVAGNTINVNRNRVNIDRGDRPNLGGWNRDNISRDRPNLGGNRPNIGDRPNLGGNRPNLGGDRPGAGANRPNLGAGNRPGLDRSQAGSALRDRASTADLNRARERGQQSLQGVRSGAVGGGGLQRPTPQPQRPAALPQRPSAAPQRPAALPQRPQAQPGRASGAFGSAQQSRATTQNFRDRGAASRAASGAGGRTGGGGRR